MPNIVVVGSYVVDLMSRTPHMPKLGETVLGGPFKMGPGGKGGNQAVSAARQGASVTMVTKVGNDLFGDTAIENFQKEGVETSYISRDPNESTGTALIAVDKNSENIIVVALGACGNLSKEDIQAAEDPIRKADIVLVQLETSIDAVKQAVKLAREHQKPIILNPAPYQEFDISLLKDITYITPNETEAGLLTNIKIENIETARLAAKKLNELGVAVVIITLGKQGCFIYDGKDDGRLIPGFKVEAIDTTGAGDAFNGAFAKYISEGLSLDDAATRANAVAALSVTKVGTAPAMPYQEEVEMLLRTSV